MRYLSVCSGIEAATVAWHPLGWEPVAFSEIEAFPSAVLAHHYPNVPNLGDMTKFQEWPDLEPNVLVGGTPCQSFSVAGLRKGLDDPRGNLMLTYLAIAHQYRPQWLVWENVPGVLSSNNGRDFASLLRGLAELGYGWAYRILDAQYFGVPQRRRRVFVVGCLGGWQRAAAVLFERASLSGHPAPRREARKDVAYSVIKGAAIGRKPEHGPQYGEHLADGSCYTLNCTEQHAIVGALDCRHAGGLICNDVAPTLGTCGASSREKEFACNGGLVAHSLRASGYDASEDGTGRGTPLVPIAWSEELTASIDVAGTVQHGGQGGRHDGVMVPVAFNWQASGKQTSLGANTLGANTLGSNTVQAVAFSENQHAIAIRTAQTSANGHGLAVDVAHTLDQAQGQAVATAMQVRRLTPRECERLQGFPDDYTLIPYRNKPAADGPRYKALGNSMAVPVMAWIGKRIEAVHAMK